jgi:ABC-2 type transport system permease protein
MRAPATSDPKMAPGGGMMGGGGPQPKGDIKSLWRMLGIEVPGKTGMGMGMGMSMGPPSFEPDLAWHRFMPYKKLQVQGIPNEWVFCRNDAPGADNAVNQDSPITAGLEELFFAVPGTIEPALDSELEFTPLASTGTMAGTIAFSDFMQFRGNPLQRQAKEEQGGVQHIAARIRELLDDAEEVEESEEAEEVVEAEDAAGEDAEEAGDAEGEDEAEAKPKRGIDVVYVADMDVMFGAFLRIRARPGEDQDIAWQFENVDFLLNTIDVLAGDETFLNIRKRKPRHSTLRLVDEQTELLQENEFDEEMKFEEEYRAEVKKITDELETKRTEAQEKLQTLEDQRRNEGQGGVRLEDLIEAQQALNIQTQLMQQRLENREKQLEAQYEENVKRLRRQTESEVRSIKHWYKGLAVMIPPIPPLLIGLIVFVRRRLREREGVSRSRLR